MMTENNPILLEDMAHIVRHTSQLWDRLRGRRLFITGGTGFIGRWLLESFVKANESFQLGAEALVLTRDYEAFRSRCRHLAEHPALKFLSGSVHEFDFTRQPVDFIIHAAADASSHRKPGEPGQLLDTIVRGTDRVLQFAQRQEIERMLYLSSGAVYGPQSPDVEFIDERFTGGPNPQDHRSAYGEAKRFAEVLCAAYYDRYGVPVSIARGFAFAGPHLPLDSIFAIGNFIGDALRGRPILIHGDGTPLRSYLYAADLTIWLWTILLNGRDNEAYNVGSDEAISIAGTAERVAKAFNDSIAVTRLQEPVAGAPVSRYIPSVEKAREELGLRIRINVDHAIQRTVRWHRLRNADDLLEELDAMAC